MNRYLLDTHVVVWLADGSPRLKNKVLEVLENPQNTIFFSPINLWEIAIKQASQNSNSPNAIRVDLDILHEQLLFNDYQELPVFSEQVKLVRNLPLYHNDPFDRLLIAQAMTENLCLITHDEKIWQYPNIQILKA